MKKYLLLLFLVLIFLIPGFVDAKVCPNGTTIPDDNTCLNLDYPAFGGFDLSVNQSLPEIVAFLYYFIVGISGLAAFVMLVIGGIQWLASGAIPSQAAEAKDKVRNAILGLLLILASFLIIQVINPELTVLNVNLLTGGEGSTPVLDVSTFSEVDPKVTAAKLPATGADNDGIYLCKEFECACAGPVCVKGTDPSISNPSTDDFLFIDPTAPGMGIALGPGLGAVGVSNLENWNDKVKAVAIQGDYAMLLADDPDYKGSIVCFTSSFGGNLGEYARKSGSFWDSSGAMSIKILVAGKCKNPGITIRNKSDADDSETDFWNDPVVFLFDGEDQGKKNNLGDPNYRRYAIPSFYAFAAGGRVTVGSASYWSTFVVAGSPAMEMYHDSKPDTICFRTTKNDLSQFSLEVADPDNNMIDDIGEIEAIEDVECTNPGQPE